jgi:hypothetical protein
MPEFPRPPEDADRFGAEAAAARLARRLDALQPSPGLRAADGTPQLSPPFSPARDHVAGPVSARITLVVQAAMLRAGLDPEGTLEAMRAGTGEDRIAEDVASALASGVAFTPALFIDGERYEDEIDEATVSATVDDLVSRL